MKKAIFAILTVVFGLALYSFAINSETTPYLDYGISEEMITIYEKDYIKTVNDEDLNYHLQKNFVRFFDEVDFVNGQFSEDNGYSYLVFGTKNGKGTTLQLLIEKSDLDNETYTYIDFTNIEVDEFTEYCWNNSSGSCPCNHITPCKNVCGIWNGSQCFSTE